MTNPKELREAIARIERYLNGCHDGSFEKSLCVAVLALKSYLATLPREVEVGGWAVVRPDGSVWAIYEQEHSAVYILRAHRDYQLIRLTGTATLPAKGG